MFLGVWVSWSGSAPIRRLRGLWVRPTPTPVSSWALWAASRAASFPSRAGRGRAVGNVESSPRRVYPPSRGTEGSPALAPLRGEGASRDVEVRRGGCVGGCLWRGQREGTGFKSSRSCRVPTSAWGPLSSPLVLLVSRVSLLLSGAGLRRMHAGCSRVSDRYR